MNDSAIRGKILALLREYRFREISDGYVRKFFTRSRIPPLPGMGLEWWLTKTGLNIRNELARMIVAAMPRLPLQVDFVAEKIEKVLQDHGDDSALFQFAYHRAESLFDIKAIPEARLAESIWTLIRDALEGAVAEWLVVVPFHRIRSASVDLGFDGLVLLDRADIETWMSVAGPFDNTRHWDPRTGVRDAKDPKIFRDRLPESWGLCRCFGTDDGATKVARNNFRTLLALLFALEFSSKPELLLKTMLDPPTFSVQFAAERANLVSPSGTLTSARWFLNRSPTSS